MTVKINDTNIQVEFESDNTIWGISFINSSDNSEPLAQIKEHATDEEYASLIEQIPTIEAENV